MVAIIGFLGGSSRWVLVEKKTQMSSFRDMIIMNKTTTFFFLLFFSFDSISSTQYGNLFIAFS